MTHYLDMWAIGLIPEKWVIDKLLVGNQLDQYEIIVWNATTDLVARHQILKIKTDKDGRIEWIS